MKISFTNLSRNQSSFILLERQPNKQGCTKNYTQAHSASNNGTKGPPFVKFQSIISVWVHTCPNKDWLIVSNWIDHPSCSPVNRNNYQTYQTGSYSPTSFSWTNNAWHTIYRLRYGFCPNKVQSTIHKYHFFWHIRRFSINTPETNLTELLIIVLTWPNCTWQQRLLFQRVLSCPNVLEENKLEHYSSNPLWGKCNFLTPCQQC